ncbi:non-hydrolyzing UDP-N-acetylglucosamine 2-epimerase [Thiohalocapsa sp. ML1]|uniref:non-hydrolyzing UDP-N-acetylglucosamine 2-epimerase n=1 Tax=Thiohalocapsa sp. ML1 TaxID=1431688 RepID=UPI0007321551|nr:UDP-N-acetylglucosamine 2-epimerase (non-hydrolyzing) [Thiohalocapsa sp. ML1]
MSLKILTIVGARPQFVKAATVSRLIKERTDIAERLVHTGQHYDYGMSDVFFSELDIPTPHYNLGVGSASQGRQTGEMLIRIEDVLLKESPDRVLVYGDTNSTLAGALAAAKLRIPVAHVEAGLRSFNRVMPEEINRIITDHISDLLFAPTVGATRQLIHEGIPAAAIHQVGDVMFDAALYYAGRGESHSLLLLDKLGLRSEGFILATVHRAENTDCVDRLSSIIGGLTDLSELLPVVFPLHPRTRRAIERLGLLEAVRQSLLVIEPVGYRDMTILEKHAKAVVTDSGGVQKEAFFFRTPCITLRDETEWGELVEYGYNCLVGADRERIVAAFKSFVSAARCWDRELFGTGTAAAEIVRLLSS